MDLGCGTGKWGLKLLKAGYPTTFSDLAQNMLMEVHKKLETWSEQPDLASKVARATVQQADATDLRIFPEQHFELITAMGDVVSICSDPGKCLSEVHRLLKPGGMFLFTVDNSLGAIDHFLASGNLEAMASFVKTGRTEWLTKNVNERFNVRMFSPQQIESLTRGRDSKWYRALARRSYRPGRIESCWKRTVRWRRSWNWKGFYNAIRQRWDGQAIFSWRHERFRNPFSLNIFVVFTLMSLPTSPAPTG